MKLTDAIRIAADRHGDDLDKSGMPYILHPIRVMLAVAPHGFAVAVVGILHDVIEDTEGLTAAEQRDLSPAQASGLDAVTRREGEVYRDFVERAEADPVGRLVKIADIRDNLSSERMANLPPEMRGIEKRYRRALQVLEPDQGEHDGTTEEQRQTA